MRTSSPSQQKSNSRSQRRRTKAQQMKLNHPIRLTGHNREGLKEEMFAPLIIKNKSIWHYLMILAGVGLMKWHFWMRAELLTKDSTWSLRIQIPGFQMTMTATQCNSPPQESSFGALRSKFLRPRASSAQSSGFLAHFVLSFLKSLESFLSNFFFQVMVLFPRFE